ncbi:hypothetical protein QJS10_CPA01g02326 [Acorus calamus]|uniref:Uncharacterized protein n=1 Tax=Acorus calamus TaxID=4465 RepID=A0AAV9FM81_ACOCL|nr:hypothetical protein QJS10_CPA01g02326 [Acorus calamus]
MDGQYLIEMIEKGVPSQSFPDQKGFWYVASGSMVLSSYKVGEFYIKSMIEADRATTAVGSQGDSLFAPSCVHSQN